MKIKKVVLATGLSSFVHFDMAGIKAGAKPNGYLFDGPPVTPGYKKIIEPAEVLSVMFVLEDGLVAYGDCVDVAVGGNSGRDRLFIPSEHMEFARKHIVDRYTGAELNSFRSAADEFDNLVVDGQRVHTAIRYGVTQAILHTVALTRREQMAQVIAREYRDLGAKLARKPTAILPSCPRDNYGLHDRMILKRADVLPHAGFNILDTHVGRDGKIFLDYVTAFKDRILEIGEPDYRPKLHFDVYGTFGEMCANDIGTMSAYLARLKEAVQPFELMIEAPVIATSRQEQIDIYKALCETNKNRGVEVRIIVDEWCNTKEDIIAFADAHAVDMAQIKMPDLGGINNTIEAGLCCERLGTAYYLGGSNNETVQSSAITAHIGLATNPEFLLSKPGMGGDESLALQKNEMIRTLAVIQQVH